jgi:eukaryotic-like serine/threonine-protein kinase
MLAKKPEDRYQRPIDVLKDLKALKIEGLDDDWTAELPGFNSADLALSTAGRLEATQQLDRLLRGSLAMQPQQWGRAGRVAAVAILALGGLVAGGIVAWVTKPAPLLVTTPANDDLNVKKWPTVREQYEMARLATHDKEEHWLAVEKYFPLEKSAENRRYARLARRGRANLYVSERRLPEALKLYEQLANVEDAETDLQLSGIAGEAVVYHRFMQNEPDRQVLEWLDQQVIERLIRLRNETNLDARISGFLAKEVRQLIEEYSQREDN